MTYSELESVSNFAFNSVSDSDSDSDSSSASMNLVFLSFSLYICILLNKPEDNSSFPFS